MLYINKYVGLFNPNNAHPMIELKRTYHPIGQGAFYTEVFTNSDNTRFVMVYDCGSETAIADMERSMDDQIDDFKQSIGPNPNIDLLFISHFHADHINGLDKLLDGVTVRKTIIPMLTSEVLLLTRVRNYLRFRDGANAADAIIRELYYDEEHSGRFGEVVVVSPKHEGEDVEEDNRNWIRNGRVLYLGEKLQYDPFWEYIPFNSITQNDQRAIDFVNDLLKIPEAIQNEQLNVSGLIRGFRKKVKEAYRKAMHKANDNLYSLVVESRPAENVTPTSDARKSHALYFGDFDSKNNDALWNRFSTLFDYDTIGTIQVPHHGSKENWREEMKEGDAREYVVSSGATNTYHHPDYWVVRSIANEGHVVHVVHEKTASMFEESFRIL